MTNKTGLDEVIAKFTKKVGLNLGVQAIQYGYLTVEVPADATDEEIADAVVLWCYDQVEHETHDTEIIYCNSEPLTNGQEVEARFARNDKGELVPKQ